MKTLKKRKFVVAKSKSQAKREAIMMEDLCMCRVHLATDKTLTSPVPCLGHGKGCPCTEILHEKAICKYCDDKCGCHKEGAENINCGCPVQGVLKKEEQKEEVAK